MKLQKNENELRNILLMSERYTAPSNLLFEFMAKFLLNIWLSE